MNIPSNISLAEKLSSKGVRPTQQRLAVYEYLVKNRNHPSADDIYQELIKSRPIFSRTTIYNSLKILADAGLVRVVSINPDEKHFDACLHDHGHFLCESCKMIFDFPLTEDDISSVCPKNFILRQSDIFFKGVCSKCQN